jgi:hypothetical protein
MHWSIKQTPIVTADLSAKYIAYIYTLIMIILVGWSSLGRYINLWFTLFYIIHKNNMEGVIILAASKTK